MMLSELIEQLKLTIQETGDCEILSGSIYSTSNFVNHNLMNQRQITIEGSMTKRVSCDYSNDGSWQ